MHYQNSKLILEEIKKVQDIVINCHRSPDPDSVGSALALKNMINAMFPEKKVSVICPDNPPLNCIFLNGFDQIRTVDFSSYDFKRHDLFVLPDSANLSQVVTGEENILQSGIRKIVLDHHLSNSGYGDINLIDVKAGSCGFVLYKFFEDINFKLNIHVAESLYTAIISDTNSFETDEIGDGVFKAVQEMIDLGVDREKIIFHLRKTKSVDQLKLIGLFLKNTKVDQSGLFAYSVLSKKELDGLEDPDSDAKSIVVGTFMQSVENTNFGFVVEEKKDFVSVSFRSRSDFDVSKIAASLGGGGHRSASAARLYMDFDQALEKILLVSRQHAKVEKN